MSEPASAVIEERIDVARLRDLLARCRFGRRIDARDSVGSTNDVARELGRQGAADGALVIAEHQSAGRGRRTREWESVAGAGLYLSLLLRPRPMQWLHTTGWSPMLRSRSIHRIFMRGV